MTAKQHDSSNHARATSDEDVQALQFVRKLSGTARPSRINEEAFNQAVLEVGAAAHRLVHALQTTAPPRNRDEELRKAKERTARRYS